MLVLEKIHPIRLYAILWIDFQIEQLISTDPRISKVEARRKVLLGAKGIRHKEVALHGQIGGVYTHSLVTGWVPKIVAKLLVSHCVSRLRIHELVWVVAVVVWFILYERRGRTGLCHLPIRVAKLLIPVNQANLFSILNHHECLIVKYTGSD